MGFRAVTAVTERPGTLTFMEAPHVPPDMSTKTIDVSTSQRLEVVDITDRVADAVPSGSYQPSSA